MPVSLDTSAADAAELARVFHEIFLLFRQCFKVEYQEEVARAAADAATRAQKGKKPRSKEWLKGRARPEPALVREGVIQGDFSAEVNDQCNVTLSFVPHKGAIQKAVGLPTDSAEIAFDLMKQLDAHSHNTFTVGVAATFSDLVDCAFVRHLTTIATFFISAAVPPALHRIDRHRCV